MIYICPNTIFVFFFLEKQLIQPNMSNIRSKKKKKKAAARATCSLLGYIPHAKRITEYKE